MSHEKLSFKHFLLQQESKQTKASLKNCVICDFTQVSLVRTLRTFQA